MVTVFAALDELESWIHPVIAAGDWPSEEKLLVWCGSTPYDSESGMMEWVGDNPKHSTFDLRRTHNGIEHDFLVTLTERSTDLFPRYPGFVAWMLGHELGHAHMALHSPTTHRLCLFVQHYIFRASGEQVQDWWHLPHEAACDGFGRFVAESAVSAERVKGDLSLLMALPELPIEAIRLKTMLENDSMPEVPDVLPALRELARPFEAPLRRAWLDEEAKGADSRVVGLRHEALFV